MNKKVDLLLRIGVSFAFIYPAISAVFNPFAWIGYFPPFMLSLFPFDSIILLHLFGVTEMIIGLWILSGKKVFIPSVLASLYLIGIIAFNFSQMDVIFRDISILLMTIALVLIHKKSFKSQNNKPVV